MDPIVIHPDSEAAQALAKAFGVNNSTNEAILDAKVTIQGRGNFVAIKVGEGMWTPSLRIQP